jgi:hypothetical protein
MKIRPYPYRPIAEDNEIAGFGSARLMRKLNGEYYLVGGDEADRAAAREWVNLFLRQASTSSPPPPPPKVHGL